MPTNTPRSFARTLAASAAAVLVAAGALLIASPASAHDELLSSDPVAGAALDALPAELTLVYSGELATDPGATEIQVTDAAGTSLADGAPSVEGTVVTQPLAGEASGTVTVLWKVVSSDGHPISGELAFSVTAPPPPTPTPTPTETVAPPPTEEPTATATPVAPPEEAAASGSDAWPWIVGGILLAALVGGVIYLLVSRARRKNAERELHNRAADAAGAGAAGASDAGSGPPADR